MTGFAQYDTEVLVAVAARCEAGIIANINVPGGEMSRNMSFKLLCKIADTLYDRGVQIESVLV